MFKKAREREERISRALSRDFQEKNLGYGSFVFSGEEGSYWVEDLGNGRVNLKVHFPLRNFGWLDRDKVGNRLKSFLREELYQYDIVYIYIND